ncbi:MAG TPA: LysR family transcriptional regulator [Saccharospirillum sp.]|nr:LysR family transcriptional regulator [Saccharospirillum sp.]
MIEFRELEAFVWIVKLGSFRMAADHLHVTQPSISERIARLESALGEQVLRRDHRPVIPTLKGRELFRRAASLLEQRQSVLDQFQVDDDFAGIFRLGVAETIAQSWLPELLNSLSLKYPQMVIELEVEGTPGLAQKLVNHELDLAFLMGPVASDHIVNRTLCEYPLNFITHPDLVAQCLSAPEKSLSELVLLTFARESIPYRDLKLLLDELGIQQPRVYCSSSGWTIARLAMAKTGIGVFSPIIVRQELTENRLAIVDLPFSLPNLRFTASRPALIDASLADTITGLAMEISTSQSWKSELAV